MPALNFQKQFAEAVESGKKRQTIRKYREDGRDPKVGDTLYLYTGMRTKQCRKLGEVECTDVQCIEVLDTTPPWHWDDDCMYIDGGSCGTFVVCPEDAELTARDDGFESWLAMHTWFKKTHGLPFEGLLIRWDVQEQPKGGE